MNHIGIVQKLKELEFTPSQAMMEIMDVQYWERYLGNGDTLAVYETSDTDRKIVIARVPLNSEASNNIVTFLNYDEVLFRVVEEWIERYA